MKQNSMHSLIDELILRLDGEDLILLESQQHTHPSSKSSYIAFRPAKSISGHGNRIVEKELGKLRQYEHDPWQAIREFRKKNKSWLFGYLGYDLKNFVENLESQNPKIADVPDFYFMEPEVLFSVTGDKITPLKGSCDFEGTIREKTINGNIDSLIPGINRAGYVQKIVEIKRRIREGDFYELNYSYPITGRFQGDAYWLYKKMREVNPVPFGSFIRNQEFSVCCASPERFLKKSGNTVISEPIKGTSARSKQIDEDKIQKELLMNEKNRAENLMIVDLVRHDLSKVAKTGSVLVSKLFDIQSFGTVHQLISSVRAEVNSDIDPVDILKACFPMGSMTGAPKITVMGAIDELEDYRRGIYSGAIGYFDPEGNFDFNVVIRSAILQNNQLVYPVGGAITSDSDPGEEWQETKIKARPLTEIFQEKGKPRNDVALN